MNANTQLTKSKGDNTIVQIVRCVSEQISLALLANMNESSLPMKDVLLNAIGFILFWFNCVCVPERVIEPLILSNLIHYSKRALYSLISEHHKLYPMIK